MKILRIIARLNVGGPARHVVWLTEAMNDAEFQTVLVAGTVPEGEEDMGYFATDHGVEPVFIEQMSRELSLKDAVSLLKVLSVVRRERPDIIHTHTAKAGTIGRVAGFTYKWLTPGTLIGRPKPVRLVHTYHGHIFHSYYGKLKTRFFLFIERTLARFASDRIIAITEQQRREINEEFRVGDPRKFRVVPLGIDLASLAHSEENRREFRKELGAAEDEIVVGIVGRLTEIKNHSMFLRAARSVLEKTGMKIRFAVIGDGSLREDLEREADELGLSASEVSFLGNRDDPDVFYSGLDIVALTSLNEGTPLSLIEAMANGNPVVSTAVGGVVDLVGDARQETGGSAGVPPAMSEANGEETGDRRQETGDDVGAGLVPAQYAEGRNQSAIDGGFPQTGQESGENADIPYTICRRGILVPSGDHAAMANAILRLASDPALRETLSNNAGDFVRKKYDKVRLIEDIRRLYRDLAG